MSSRDAALFVGDMLDAIGKIERYTRKLSLAQFRRREMVIDAVVRNLGIIGEAARQIPPVTRARHAGVEWTRVTGFRNIVIHAYFDVDVEIVWTIATQRLPELKAVLQAITAESNQDHEGR